MKLKRHHTGVPQLQMAAMPDLIFTILFFFMIVTHMRENTMHVQYKQPEGQNLTKVTNKASIINVYVGKDMKTGEIQVQVEDEITSIYALADQIEEEVDKLADNSSDKLAVSLQADRDVPMAYINKVKMALREAKVLKINYEGREVPSANTNKRNEKQNLQEINKK